MDTSSSVSVQLDSESVSVALECGGDEETMKSMIRASFCLHDRAQAGASCLDRGSSSLLAPHSTSQLERDDGGCLPGPRSSGD
jgi:hypothetical protein